MDKVRFGRALGFGARQAGKALIQAADAALKPDPNVTRQAGARVRQNLVGARTTSSSVAREGKRFGRAVWGPFAKASGVLWLELTGVFFGLFALTAAVELYRHHHDFLVPGRARQHLCFAAAMFVLFGWFTVSSFIRAHRRSRR